MKTWLAAATALGIGMTTAAPASAQFYFQSRDLSGAPVTGEEPGIVEKLPGATAAELRANLVWNMRAALNIAALQCQFEPTLLTVDNYNALLRNHRDELKGAFDTLTRYFTRLNKAPKAAQAALDQYGTRTYSSYSIVAAQLNFCQTAAGIGRDAKSVTRGGFGTFATLRSRELRNSLTPWGEQRFSYYMPNDRAPLPRLDAQCWDKKARWVAKKCGPSAWPPVSAVETGAAVAAR